MSDSNYNARPPTLVFNSRKGTEALKQSLQEAGCLLVEDCWETDRLEASKPDGIVLDFYEAVRNLPRTYRLKRWARRNGVRVAALDRDAPWHRGVKTWRLRLFGWLGLADIYATHSLQDAERFAKRVEYFPNAARLPDYGLGKTSLETLRDPQQYRYDVCFVGNLNAQRYPEHAERVAFFTALESALAADGIRCQFADSAGMTPARQVELIQASKININYGAACDSRGVKSWGLPERCYGVPACGGFLLSDRREHASKDFELHTEWAEFDDVPSCVAQIRHYLQHFEQARALAEAAHRRVLRDHTYARRAAQLLFLFNEAKDVRIL